jgi:hypothetical protein
MMWVYYVVGWLLVGFVAVASGVYYGYKDGDDFTLGDLGMVFIITLTGPIFAIWLLKEVAVDKSSTVLIKGRRANDAER